MATNRRKIIVLMGSCAALVAATTYAASGDSGGDSGTEKIGQRMATLSSEVERAEAVKAVKRIQYAYGHYLELGLWRDLADLFADDAVGYYPAGKFVGKQSLYRHFLQNVGGGRLGLSEGQFRPHIVLQPVVTLGADGKTAKGRWHVFAMLGNYGRSAGWAGGIYENEYVDDHGVWKIKTLHYHSQYSGSYEKGWNEVRTASLRSPRKLAHPADGPREEACETYLDGCTIPFHYTVMQAGIPIPNIGQSVAASKNAPSFASLRNRMVDLAVRVRRMNDETEVANLQHAYGYYVDRKMWDDVADLFAEDATMELGQRGVYVGKASIRHSLDQFGPPGLREGELNDHLQLQTVVTVSPDGLRARARGTELGMLGMNNRGAQWTEGVYENEYVKADGVWKIKSMHVYPRMITDYYRGWAEDAQPAPGPSKDFPPDKPTTITYQIYPHVYLVPVDFANPVTGKMPRYPSGVGATAFRFAASKSKRPAVRTESELESLLAETERKLAIAKAYDGAENVANAYGYYIDEFAWDDMADLFAEQGSKELSYIGTYVGRERIRQSVKLRYPTNGRRPGAFTLHQETQPVIDVAPDGQSARIRTRLFQVNGAKNGDGSYIAGIYENEAVLENGVWKIKSMDLDYTWTTSYKSGWAHVGERAARRFAPRGNSGGGLAAEFPPDRPLRGAVYPPFPKIAELAFHYKNPVSGREPPILLP